jgi:hypothetical protein
MTASLLWSAAEQSLLDSAQAHAVPVDRAVNAEESRSLHIPASSGQGGDSGCEEPETLHWLACAGCNKWRLVTHACQAAWTHRDDATCASMRRPAGYPQPCSCSQPCDGCGCERCTCTEDWGSEEEPFVQPLAPAAQPPKLTAPPADLDTGGQGRKRRRESAEGEGVVPACLLGQTSATGGQTQEAGTKPEQNQQQQQQQQCEVLDMPGQQVAPSVATTPSPPPRAGVESQLVNLTASEGEADDEEAETIVID